MENNVGQVVLVKDIAPGTNNYGYDGSYPKGFVEFNNKLYFGANSDENGEEELWVSDGTTEGTRLLADIKRSSGDYDLGTKQLDLAELNGKIYFSASDGENGRELWVSDGTTGGTKLLVDINSDNSSFSNSSAPTDFIKYNDKLYFSADDGENGRELWVSDGTSEGTNLVADINSGTGRYGEPSGSFPNDFIELNGKLYFSADDGENGRELWVSDGTSEGTNLVADINLGSSYGYANSSDPSNFTKFNNKLYFSADDGENGRELWVSDGTTGGTNLVADIYPGIDNYGDAYGSQLPLYEDFTEFKGRLYFSAVDGENGRELWVSDGTSEGTNLLKDINPGSDGSYPSNPFEFNGKLYFAADDGSETGNELWVSDGTSEGTQLVADINPNRISSYPDYYTGSNPDNFVEFNGKLYFAADDGSETGNELWVSDGTSEGTQLVADINPGADDSYPSGFTVFNNELFFRAVTSETSGELFKLTFDSSHQPQQPLPTNAIDGTNGKDNLVGTDGIDLINGFKGKDTLDGGAGNDTLLGGKGKDSLVGGAGDDSLVSGNGKDILNGGIGSDILTGGKGKDTFVIASGNGEDTITDFELGKDSLGLINLEFHDLSFSGNAIYTENELLATLTDIDTESLREDDFTLM